MTMELVILVEELSMKETLIPLIKKMGIPDENYIVVFHSGISDLKKSIPRKLRAWQKPGAYFLIMCDNDNGDCKYRKREFLELCSAAGKGDVSTVRIICQELEAWFLGDLAAVDSSGLAGTGKLSKLQNKHKNPDSRSQPSKVMKKMVIGYQKVLGAQAIAPHLNIDDNHSHSFHMVISSLKDFKKKLGI